MRKWIILALSVLLMPVAKAAEAEESTRLLRYPDVHGDRIVFVYSGDLWWVSAEGGDAHRLTSHPGAELSPKFSPDGRWIAFSAEYSGTRQVHVIPADGGAPRQLTFYNDVGVLPPRGGFDNRVLDWTPDGEEILFLGNRLPWGPRRSRPHLVPAAGGMERPLSIVESGTAMFSPDGRRLVFTPTAREFRTWKRYRGGQSQDVWVYDLEADQAERVTTDAGSDHQPMWVGDTLFFTSDRNGKLNLFAVPARDAARGEEVLRQVTDHDDYDVLWPSAGPDKIVYQSGGRLHLFDPASGESKRLDVRVTGDFPRRLPYVKNLADEVVNASLSPSGKRAVIEARGELFSVPAQKGPTRNLTRSQGVREMDPAWSPDGRWIAYQSDASGEYEIYVRPQEGGEAKRLTTDGDVWRFAPAWSPDSAKLAYGDKKQRLRVLDVESGAIVDIDRGVRQDIQSYVWSPDSRWLAYVKSEESGLPSIWVHSLDEKKSWRLTSEMTADFSPAFDPEGRYLYFLSNRDYNLTFSSYEFNYFYNNATRVYAGLLTDDGPALFRPQSDEEEPAPAEDAAAPDAGKSAKGKEKKGKKDRPAEDAGGEDADPFRIQVEGFNDRVIALPGPSGNYNGLRATAAGPVYLFQNNGPPVLKRVRLDSEQEETILDGVGAYDLSADGKKVLFFRRGDLGIVDLAPGASADSGKLDLSRMDVEIDPAAEWTQLYTDAWRILRDWFYDPEVHGVDWEDVRRRYAEMLPHVVDRSDLNHLLGEVAGELEAGHIYVQPGDEPSVERVEGGLLGAEILADSGAFRIASIFEGENWHERTRSPLTEPGVGVEEGDYILAVDGRDASEVENFYELLANAGNRVVTLTVNDSPSREGARDVRVRTITSETSLRYLDWIEERRRRVTEASDGRVGYIHLPDTAVNGNRELRKGFYPQAHKDALIFDARYNGGGFVPDRMIELVSRPLLNYWARRGLELGTVPGFVHVGPKAVLMNGYSGSGGDAFPYYFRKLGLGPLIGTTTWGGLIGISFTPSLADGGSVTAASFRFVDTDGDWAVEGVGVEPDIEVMDRPDALARGEDPTLERAIEEMLKALEEQPPVDLDPPTPPNHGG